MTVRQAMARPDAQPGAHSVTRCTQRQEFFVGAMLNGQGHLNKAGEMVRRWRRELNQKHLLAQTGAAVVMPGHVQGILIVG